MRDLIESGGPLSNRIAAIISDAQILLARLRSVARASRPGSSSLILPINLMNYTINAATLYARAAALFEYARNQTNEVPELNSTEQQIRNALNLLGFDATTHDLMYRLVAERARRNPRPTLPVRAGEDRAAEP
jgi:hypothetical protein